MRRDELLGQVASWYFEEGLGQSEIAGRIHRSRSMVSRLLTEARNRGIVEIRINIPITRNSGLERRLADEFGLRGAYVCDAIESPLMQRRALGRLGAECLKDHVSDGMILGVAWSRTLRTVVHEMPRLPMRNVKVVQLSGSAASPDARIDGPDLVRTIAEKLAADYRFFPAPLVVASAALRDALMGEDTVGETLRMAERSDVALVGVGNVASGDSSLRVSGLLNEAEESELLASGVAGDITSCQFGPDGQPLPVAFNRRVIGIGPAALRRIPTVIAVAAGPDKVGAIRAAARGKWFTVLVTDAPTARELLTKHQARKEAS